MTRRLLVGAEDHHRFSLHKGVASEPARAHHDDVGCCKSFIHGSAPVLHEGDRRMAGDHRLIGDQVPSDGCNLTTPGITGSCSMAPQNAWADSSRMLSGEVASMATGPS